MGWHSCCSVRGAEQRKRPWRHTSPIQYQCPDTLDGHWWVMEGKHSLCLGSPSIVDVTQRNPNPNFASGYGLLEDGGSLSLCAARALVPPGLISCTAWGMAAVSCNIYLVPAVSVGSGVGPFHPPSLPPQGTGAGLARGNHGSRPKTGWWPYRQPLGLPFIRTFTLCTPCPVCHPDAPPTPFRYMDVQRLPGCIVLACCGPDASFGWPAVWQWAFDPGPSRAVLKHARLLLLLLSDSPPPNRRVP